MFAASLLAILYVIRVYVIGHVFLDLDGSLTVELARLAVKFQEPSYLELNQALSDAGVKDFTHDVTSQVRCFKAAFSSPALTFCPAGLLITGP